MAEGRRWTIVEAADELGVHPSTVHKFIAREELPFERLDQKHNRGRRSVILLGPDAMAVLRQAYPKGGRGPNAPSPKATPNSNLAKDFVDRYAVQLQRMLEQYEEALRKQFADEIRGRK